MTGPTVILDLDAFRHNVRTLAQLAAPARCMIAVKANAYGHGMVPFARAAVEAGAQALAVLEVPAGLELRAAGVDVSLFAWLHGEQTDFSAAIAGDIELGVSSLIELNRILAAVEDVPAAVHLKIDTGLHRNGASPEDWPALVSAAREAEIAGRVRIAGLWSHLADASPEDDAAALAEFRAAVAVAAGLGVEDPFLHLAASSAGIREPEARFDQVRFGIAAYGISPFDDVDGRGLGLRPVMTARAPVLAVDDGRAVLAAGSADGVPPSVLGPSGSGAWVLLGGVRREIVEIGVDTLEVDLGEGTARAGDVATLFGAGDDGEPTAEEWAAWAGTVGDEIVARASTRGERILRG
ncbi:MAG TPA: alanine racemase [Pseudolysinimonas sp.]|jgi:alanine racemase|nr:alanine racemase [Pseudolysinimonas sp.]